jgi:hypothetical protein
LLKDWKEILLWKAKGQELSHRQKQRSWGLHKFMYRSRYSLREIFVNSWSKWERRLQYHSKSVKKRLWKRANKLQRNQSKYLALRVDRNKNWRALEREKRSIQQARFLCSWSFKKITVIILWVQNSIHNIFADIPKELFI